MYIIIVGGGKIGYNLTKFLLAAKHEVLLIEKDEVRASALVAQFGEAVVIAGDGSRVLTLREGGTNRANVLVAVTGADEENLVICQVAKTVFNCPRTIARVNDPRDESLFSALGVDATVSSTRVINALIEEQVNADNMIIPLLTLRAGNIDIIEMGLSKSSGVMGKQIREISLPEGSRIIAILRGDDVVIPTGESKLILNDKVLVLVKKEVEPQMRELLQK
jgi:trk system potassium uptake protein TrkA